MSAPTGKLKLAYQSLAAAEARETALRQELSTANRTIASMLNNGWAELDDAKQRLTAADERVEVLEGLLLQSNELFYAIQDDLGVVMASVVDVMRGKVFTALKPADAHPCPVHLDGCDGSCKP